ncbi:MAG TPA: hypothetical protein VNJ08_05530 [Bacteriovoracaceae bacterium]|nr:hypothetical protein [Bacteriovoracaceae bacterium]
MKDKLKAHFLKFGPRRFVVLTVLTLLMTDLINCYYLKLYWLSKNMSLTLVKQTLTRSGQLVEGLSPSTIQEMTGFVSNAFYFFIFIILVNNLFFYLFYLRRKLWAQGFILFYVLTGAILQLGFVFDNSGMGYGWLAYNLLTVPYYIYLFLGVKLLKAETTDISPASGKKAR